MFFKWLAKKISKANLDNDYPVSSTGLKIASDDDYDEQISFSLTSAVGGRILKVRRYDRKIHEADNQVYVIPQGEDVGERVTKIINLELIK
jgi:hypothetical protein